MIGLIGSHPLLADTNGIPACVTARPPPSNHPSRPQRAETATRSPEAEALTRKARFPSAPSPSHARPRCQQQQQQLQLGRVWSVGAALPHELSESTPAPACQPRTRQTPPPAPATQTRACACATAGPAQQQPAAAALVPRHACCCCRRRRRPTCADGACTLHAQWESAAGTRYAPRCSPLTALTRCSRCASGAQARPEPGGVRCCCRADVSPPPPLLLLLGVARQRQTDGTRQTLRARVPPCRCRRQGCRGARRAARTPTRGRTSCRCRCPRARPLAAC
mmetsp:Transcript_3169/g.9814  ORF Transcript_3169/g.9814 Transcript_3169/m.9814 type:complete len:279 (-) Transcript_3169:433-1269(-)